MQGEPPHETSRADGPGVIDVAGLQAAIEALRAEGRTVIGPTAAGDAIALGEVSSVEDLPRDWGDEQEAARYRLRRRGDGALFGFAATAQSWKSVLFPSRELAWSARRRGGEMTVTAPAPDSYPSYALLGVRACDLRAIAVHDRVLLGRQFADPAYAARRRDAFIIAVACAHPGGTCFCVSMGAGPSPENGFDLSLTELLDSGDHRFLVTPGSDRGARLLAALPSTPATADDRAAADAVVADSAARMGRFLDTEGIRDLLYGNAEHPRWDDAASRCLACTNCTLVCPTCFCVSPDDVSDLSGAETTRHRVWDSCFTADFSHLPGGSVRPDIRSRYRQWVTHKLASWIDQFGMSGCVGCGRCITWCPAAIDITEEAAALRAPAAAGDGAR